jgi:predicted nucleic acid-binding protein
MILIDNTVLSNFASIRHPEYISRAFREEIGSTEAVFDELKAGIRLGRVPMCEWEQLKKIQMTSLEQSQFRQLNRKLGRGEASCLAVAVQRNWKVATDDKDARQWAVRLNVPHTGTLGILVILVKHGYIELSKGNEFLRRMMEAGYHSPITELDHLVSL